MRNRLIIFLLCIICSNPAFSKEEGRPTDIQVEVGKVTQVEFPTTIAKVIKGGNQDSVLVEVLENCVYLLPKTEEPSDIFVTTTAGISYPLNLHIGTRRDIKIQVGSFKNKKNNHAGAYVDVMDVMKDLLLEKEPAGATVLPANGQILLSNPQMSLSVEKAYEMMDWNAYVLVARNLINNAVIIPIEQMNLPNLLAVSCNRDMIAAKGQVGDTARVYIIVGKSDEYTTI